MCPPLLKLNDEQSGQPQNGCGGPCAIENVMKPSCPDAKVKPADLKRQSKQVSRGLYFRHTSLQSSLCKRVPGDEPSLSHVAHKLSILNNDLST